LERRLVDRRGQGDDCHATRHGQALDFRASPNFPNPASTFSHTKRKTDTFFVTRRSRTTPPSRGPGT
jgi:hypothetical protein